MNRATNAAFSILLAAVLFVCVVIIANFFLHGVRVDLTQNKRFSLSEGTLNVLKSIEEPITLRFFFSQDLANRIPQIRIYGERVHDLLREYETRAGGKILFEAIDPEPFSEDEDRAVALGVAQIPTQTGENLYFGLAGTNAVDGRSVIPFFSEDRQSFLEYDVTEMIYKLSVDARPKVGLMGDISLELGAMGPEAMMQGQFQPYLIYEELSETFDLEPVASNVDRIAEDIDTLVVVHPATFAPKTLYALDQFVLRGGRLLAFVDPLSEMSRQPSMMGLPEGPGQSSTLAPLLDAWGVGFDPKKVVGDLNQALRVQLDRSAGRPIGDYIAWIEPRNDDLPPSFNTDDVVTTALQNIRFGSAGAFAATEKAATTVTPLIQSTADSMLIDSDEVAFSFDPDELIRSFLPTPERYALAVRIAGPVKSAYPDGPPPEEASEDVAETGDGDSEGAATGNAAAEDAAPPEAGEEKEPLPAHLAESKEPVNVILVADTDLLDDRFWVTVQDFFGQQVIQPTAQNADFVINAVENLSGSSDLIGLRSRGEDKRPLTAVENLQRAADQRFVAQQVALENELNETETRLNELQAQGSGGGSTLGLTAEEEAEVDRFRQHLIETRRALREVQRGLRADIEVLETKVRWINILLMPLMVAATALGVGVMRRRRWRRSAAGAR